MKSLEHRGSKTTDAEIPINFNIGATLKEINSLFSILACKYERRRKVFTLHCTEINDACQRGRCRVWGFARVRNGRWVYGFVWSFKAPGRLKIVLRRFILTN